MSDRIQEFIVEAREHLGIVEDCLLTLEKPIDSGAVPACVDRCFRAIHSIKGDAGFLGLPRIHELAHAMESLLNEIHAPISPQAIEVLLTARDWLAVLVDDATRNHPYEIGDILAQLTSAMGSDGSKQFETDVRDWAADTGIVDFLRSAATHSQFDNGRLDIQSTDLRQQLPSGPVRWITPFEVVRPKSDQTSSVAPSKASKRNRFERLKVEFTNWSRSQPGLMNRFRELKGVTDRVWGMLDIPTTDLRSSLPDPPVTWQFGCETDRTPDQLVREFQIELPGDQQTSTVAPPAAVGPASTISNSEPATVPQESNSPSSRALPQFSGGEKASTLRIQVELLDQLMTLVGELTLVRNQSLLAFADESGSQRAILQRLNSVTSELQDVTLRARMQSISTLFGKFPRMVRDLARQLGKNIEIELRGGEVEVDKTILEHLSDPLMHLIRNSIDHGIEMPDERIVKGKSPVGHIVLSAVHDDGQVYIQISDDGRGIDADAVKARALKLGIKSQAELIQLSVRELHSLIMLPGFSTASNVTEVSGRGVGMDVVKTNIEKLEGTIGIDSVLGHGCSIGLRLPLTLAIIPCLVVKVGSEQFAVPQRELVEVVILHPHLPERIERAFDTEVFRLRDQLIPIIRMSDVMSRKTPFTPEDKAQILNSRSSFGSDKIEYILILRMNGHRFGLVVDQVQGMQEIVVKPMHPSLKRVGIFAGATIMGDGSVALITDAEGIVQHARLSFESADDSFLQRPTVRDAAEVHRVLLFEYGPHERFALPLLQTRRVEMISNKDLERVGDEEYISIEGVSTKVLRLDRFLNVSGVQTDPPLMSLILPKFVPQPMGILASRIVDTESLSLDLQHHPDQSQGILGSAVVHDRMTLFLDLHELYQKLFDIRDSSASFAQTSVARNKRVLLIDDTAFFREVVKRYLSAEGYDVETAMHGRDALERLATDSSFELIVSDIEMPVMDGWEFAREARRRGIQTPMLALTSLSGPQYESKATECGYDGYEVKLDHDRLIRKVSSMIVSREVAR